MEDADQLEALRSMVREGRFVQAVRSTEAFIADCPGPEMESRLYHILSVARQRLGQLWPALDAARRAESLAAEWLQPELLAKVRVNLISLYSDVGDFGLASDLGAKLLGEVLPETVRKDLPRVHYNLAYVARGRHDRSLMHEHMGRAIKLGEELGVSPAFMVKAHQQAAWWWYLEDAIEAGDQHVAAAGVLIEPEDIEGKREQLLLAALRAHQTGDMNQTLAVAEEFLTKGSPATLLQRAWASYLTASAALYLECLDRAVEIVSRAVDMAIELKSPEHMNRVNELRIQVMKRKETAG